MKEITVEIREKSISIQAENVGENYKELIDLLKNCISAFENADKIDFFKNEIIVEKK